MANGWTLERQQRQSKLIKQWKPWEQSTGAKTKNGKLKTSQNAYKGGQRKYLRELARALRSQSNVCTKINNMELEIQY